MSRLTRHAKPISSFHRLLSVVWTRLNGIHSFLMTQSWGILCKMRIYGLCLGPEQLAAKRDRTPEKWRWSIDGWAMCALKANMKCSCHWGDWWAGKHKCNVSCADTHKPANTHKTRTLFFLFFKRQKSINTFLQVPIVYTVCVQVTNFILMLYNGVFLVDTLFS